MAAQQLEVIGIDHGWQNMKIRSNVFGSGIKEIATEPAFFDNVLEYNGKYYKVGTGRVGVTNTKVEDDNYFHLTLAAIGKELAARNKRKADILIAAGLPLTRFGSEKDDFVSYLSRERELKFRFEEKEYEVTVEKVCVYPQCYAAVADRLKSLPDKVCIVDLGSWTIDIMPLYKQIPDESTCVTIPEGLITCMHAINNQCVRLFNTKLDEMDIQDVMCGGNSGLPEEYREVIYQGLKEFTDKIKNYLNEGGIRVATTPVTFVGGGASIMKTFGSLQGRQVKYVEDIKANAKGYEYLAGLAVRSGNLKIG